MTLDIKRLLKQIVPILLFSVVVIFVWINSPAGIHGKIWWVGSAVCHQKSDHSFHLHEAQFPLCSRCAGTYLSSSIALIYFFLKGKKAALPKKGISILFLIFFLFWAGDGVNSFSYDVFNHTLLYEPNNILRFLSGIGMGMTFALTITTIFNLVVWKEKKNIPLLQSWNEVFLLLAIELPLIAFPFLQSSILFSAAAVISIIGVLALIGLLYTILIILLFRNEGKYTDLKSLLPILLLGFAAALLQVYLMAGLRANSLPFSIFAL